MDLVDQAVRLVGQLPDNAVPLGKALVTGLAVGKSSREASSTDVAAGPGHALHADALTAALVALRLGDATRVAVACWGDRQMREALRLSENVQTQFMQGHGSTLKRTAKTNWLPAGIAPFL